MDAASAAAASCGLMIVAFAVAGVVLLRPSRRSDVEMERLRDEVAELRREQQRRVGS